jgi:hypothetical protein
MRLEDRRRSPANQRGTTMSTFLLLLLGLLMAAPSLHADEAEDKAN